MSGYSFKIDTGLVLPYAEKLKRSLYTYFESVCICGSIRRECEKVGDVDIVVVDDYDLDINLYKIIKDTFNTDVKIVQELCQNKRSRYSCKFDNIPVPLDFDIWVTNKKTLGSGILYATGPGLSNVVMRRWARYNNMSLSFEGVFDKDNNLIASKTEKECCNVLGWDYVKPQFRFKDDRYFGKYLDIMNK